MKEPEPQKPKNVFLRDLPEPVVEALKIFVIGLGVFATIGLFGLTIKSLFGP